MPTAHQNIVYVSPTQPISLSTRRAKAAASAISVLLLANDMMEAAALAGDSNVVQTASVERALVLAASGDFDVVVVDFRPDLLGHQAICKLRMAQIELPILFVSARSTTDAVERAYEVGADDVVVSLDAAALRQRVTALAAGFNAQTRMHSMQVGRLEIDLIDRKARVDGKAVALAADEYGALEVLASGNGTLVGKSAFAKTGAASNRETDALMLRLQRKMHHAGVGELITGAARLGYSLGAGCTAYRSAAVAMASAA